MHRRTLAVAAVALLAGGRAAQAHAHLRSAVPAPDSMLDVAPTQVAITFSEALEPRFSTIEVRGPGGARFDDGAAHAGADAKVLVVALKKLTPGSYTVAWHATSVDTHKTEGSFAFMLHG
jgi:methionine-rich copper-binding protein CopC